MTKGLALSEWMPSLQTKFKSIVTRCADDRCRLTPRFVGLLPSSRDGIRVGDLWYCSPDCFERALVRRLRALFSASEFRARRTHRIPLGLILMSHGFIDQAQLSAALAAQREAGKGRIGEWLGRFAGVDEQQITRALSEQWCCPVLRSSSMIPGLAESIPLVLLEHHRMLPVHQTDCPPTMYIAFSDYVDRAVLYGVERMLNCRTEPCVVADSVMSRSLEHLGIGAGQNEIVFDAAGSWADAARITRNYAVQSHADEARIVTCGDHLWIRLLRTGQWLDLMFAVNGHGADGTRCCLG